MRNRRFYLNIAVLALLPCCLVGCGKKDEVPRRQERESRPSVILVEQGIEEPKLEEEKRELPAHEQAQNELDTFLEAFNEVAETDCQLTLEKDFDFARYQDGNVFQLRQNDIFPFLWVKPDEEKVWNVKYYKDSGTGRVSFEINGMWIGDRQIDKASELFIWKTDFLAVMFVEGNVDKDKIEILNHILGDAQAAEENLF